MNEELRRKLERCEAELDDERVARTRLEGEWIDLKHRSSIQAEARLQFIFDSVPIGISLTHETPDGRVTRIINDAHLAISGLTREEVDDPANFRRISHPDDHQKQLSLIRELESGAIDHFSLEKRYYRPDGSIAWIILSMQRRHYPDGCFDQLSTVVDVTAMKVAQEAVVQERSRLKFIFDTLPVGVAWRRLADEHSLICNPAFVRISGIDANACSCERLDAGLHPAERQKHEVLSRRLAAEEVDAYEAELRYLHPDGEVRWVVRSVRRFGVNDSGDAQELTALVDITDQKLAEIDAKAARRDLADISRQAGMAEIAASVLHHVGNALNSLNVSANLINEQLRRSSLPRLVRFNGLIQARAGDLATYLTSDERGRKVPEYLAMLASNFTTEHEAVLAELAQLSGHVCRVQETVAAQQQIARVVGIREQTSIHEIIDRAIRVGESREEVEVGCEVRKTSDDIVVRLDRMKLLSILVNLLTNAREACAAIPQGEIVVECSRGTEREVCCIEVRDNGVGMPDGHAAKLFTVGFTTKGEGRGFGLHTAAIFARELGGLLSGFSGGKNKGACFRLEFPLDQN